MDKQDESLFLLQIADSLLQINIESNKAALSKESTDYRKIIFESSAKIRGIANLLVDTYKKRKALEEGVSC